MRDAKSQEKETADTGPGFFSLDRFCGCFHFQIAVDTKLFLLPLKPHRVLLASGHGISLEKFLIQPPEYCLQ